MHPTLPASAEALLERERDLLGTLDVLLERLDADPALRERLGELASALNDLFLLVIVGEFNAGKSTVLNALFGEAILEEGPVPTTDRITMLRYGENDEVHRQGEHISTRTLPIPLLKSMVLVDTPGTNSIIQEHQRLTEDFIPRSDLVLFVTSYDRPLSESERTFLGYIREAWGRRLVMVVNKADLAEDEAALEQVLSHVKTAVEDRTGTSPTIFPIAARLALQAKVENPSAPHQHPEWTRSGFGPFETFLTNTLTDDALLALKLGSPLDAAETIVSHAGELIEERNDVLAQDKETLNNLQARFSEKEEALSEVTARAVSDVDRELLEMERRGVQFLDDTIRVGRIKLLRDRDAFKEEFAKQVLRDAENRIEARAGEAADGLLRHVYELWNETYAQLSQLRQPEEGQRDSFLYDREAVLREVLKDARRTIETYDLREEARRLLENARSAAALFTGLQAAAVGLGAIAAIVVAATAFDVTGGFIAAGALAIFGFILLPRQRKRAIREFTERVDALRTDLKRALERAFEEETQEAIGRVRTLLQPLENLVREQSDILANATTDAEAIGEDIDGLRNDVAQKFGTATV